MTATTTAYDPSILRQLSIMERAAGEQVEYLLKINGMVFSRVEKGDDSCLKCELCVERREISGKMEKLIATARHLSNEYKKAGAEARSMARAHRTRDADAYRARFERLRNRYLTLMRSNDSFYGRLTELEQQRKALVIATTDEQ